MKHIQVIDSAENCSYSIYAVSDRDFAVLFPNPGQDIEFVDDLTVRLGVRAAGDLVINATSKYVDKKNVVGIHGTIFIGLCDRRRYYPNKQEHDLDIPDLSRIFENNVKKKTPRNRRRRNWHVDEGSALEGQVLVDAQGSQVPGPIVMAKMWRPGRDQDYMLSVCSQIESNGDLGDPKWLRDVRPQLCPECNWPSHLWYPRPVDVVLKRLPKGTDDGVNCVGPTVMRKAFYEYLEPCNKTCAIGKVSLRQGKELHDTDYISIYDIAENMIEMRGQIEFRGECILCHVPAPWPKGNFFVWRSELASRDFVYDGLYLLISRHLNDLIPWGKFPDMGKYRVYIRDDE